MPSVEQEGQVTADGTEQTLGSVTSNRNLILIVDPSAMLAGDRIILRAKRKLRSSSVSLVTFDTREVSGKQGGLVALDPMPSPYEALYTLEQTGGTNRDYGFTIEAL